MSKKTIKANSVNTTHGNVEFEQPSSYTHLSAIQGFVQENEPKYPTGLLVKSEALKCFGLHIDVIRGILIKPEYTIKDAKEAIQKYIDSFNK